MKGGDLFDRIVSKGVFSEQEARISMFNIVSAVEYLHETSLVHRDLKPENLLYTSKEEDAVLKISDFGLSKYSHESEGLETPCGTLAYTAPEITNNKVYRKVVDIWSCGCIMYFMLFGRPPFYSDIEEEIYNLVSEGIYIFPSKPHVTDSAKELIGFLLEKDPNKRYSSKQALSHPWITGCNGRELAVSPPRSNSQPIAIATPNSRIMLRTSLNSALNAQRGPLTPPLSSPLESSLWKKRARKNASLTQPLIPLEEDFLEPEAARSNIEEDVDQIDHARMEMDIDMLINDDNSWSTRKSAQ